MAEPSYTSIAATMNLAADTISFDDPTLADKYGIKDMRFNRVVLRGGLRVKKVQAPGPSGQLVGTYSVALPTIGPIDSGVAPSNTDNDGYNTLTSLIAGTAGTDITLTADTNYVLNAAVQVPSGKNLQAADGTTVYITRADGYDGNLFEATSGTSATISNLRFEGKADQAHSAAEGSNNACSIRVYGGSNLVIQHCKFYRDPSNAIFAYNHTNITIQYCEFEDSWAPVEINGNNLTNNGLVQGNHLNNTSAFKSYNGLIGYNTGGLRVYHNQIYGAGLLNPTVLPTGAVPSIGNSIYIYDSNDFIIENNNCGTSYAQGFFCGRATTNAFVRHNYFPGGYGATPNSGVRSNCATIGLTGPTSIITDNITFDLNLCDGGVSVGESGGDHCTITNNWINTWGIGILVSDSAISCLVQSNTINRMAGSTHGIFLLNKNTAAVNCRVLSNTITGFLNGIFINNTNNVGTVFGLTVTGNVFFGCTTNIGIPSAIVVHASCTIQGYQQPVPTPAPTSPPPTSPPAPTESLQGSTIPSFTVLYDAALGAWTVAGGVIFLNGSAAGFSQNVTLLLYFNHTIFQQNQAGGWWSWTNNNWLDTTDPRPLPISAGPVPVPDITNAARHVKDLLQMGNSPTGCYFVSDNRWGSQTINEGTTSSTYAQSIERSLQVGSAGEVAWRMIARWPDTVNGVSTDGGTFPEVKNFPASIYGAKPGYFGSDRWPAWDFALRLPDGQQVPTPPDGTPGPIAADWAIGGGSVSAVVPAGTTPGSNLPRSLATMSSGSITIAGRFVYPTFTGKGHLAFDCWLQDPVQPAQTKGFFQAPITHEIMVPLRNVGAYGRYPNGRNPGWLDHDVTLNGVLYHVYCAKNTAGPGLQYNFGGLSGAYTNEETGGPRTGWKFIVFQHDGDAHPLDANGKFNVPLSQMLNHLKTVFDSRGIAFVRGTESLVSIELGVEQVYGQVDITAYDYKVTVS